MTVKLLTEHHLEFLSLKGGCRGSSESTLVKMSNCWKSHAAAQLSCRGGGHWQLYFVFLLLHEGICVLWFSLMVQWIDMSRDM